MRASVLPHNTRPRVVAFADDDPLPAITSASSGESPTSAAHAGSSLPLADFRAAAHLFLRLMWSEGHDVLLSATKLLAHTGTTRRRLSAGGGPDPTDAAMRRQLDGASKYAVLSAVHLSRCPCIDRVVWCGGGGDASHTDPLGAYDFLLPEEMARRCMLGGGAAAAATTTHRPIAQGRQRGSLRSASRSSSSGGGGGGEVDLVVKLTRSVSVFLITLFQEKFLHNSSTAAAAAATVDEEDAEELLSCALRVLPGCFCVETEDMPLVSLVFPELCVVPGTEAWVGKDSVVVPHADLCSSSSRSSRGTTVAVCRHEWSRAVMPQLAVSMVFEQFAAMQFDKAVKRRCLRRWRAAIHRRDCSPPPFSSRQSTSNTRINSAVVVAVDDGLHPPTAAFSGAAAAAALRSDGELQQDERRPHMRLGVRPPRATDRSADAPSHLGGGASVRAAEVAAVSHERTVQTADVPPSVATTPTAPSEPPPPQLCATFAAWKDAVFDPYIKEADRRRESYLSLQVHALRARRVHLIHQRAAAKKLLRTAFEQWRDVFVPQEKAIRALAVQRSTKLKRGAWLRWRLRWCEEDQLHREAEANVKLGLLLDVKGAEQLMSCFLRWDLEAKRSRFFRAHTGARCIAHWRRCAALAATFGSAEVSAEDVRARRLSTEVLHSWRQRLRQVVADRHALAKGFRRWASTYHRAVNHRNDCITAATFHLSCLTRRVVHRWHHQWSVVRPLAIESQHVVECWRQRKILFTWRKRAASSRALSLLLGTFTAQRAEAMLRMLLERWRSRAVLRGASHCLRTRRRHIALSSCFTRWHQRVWLLGVLRDQAEHEAIDHEKRQMRRHVVRHWYNRLWQRNIVHHEAVTAQLEHTAAAHRRNALLRRVLHIWSGARAAVVVGGAGGALHDAVDSRHPHHYIRNVGPHDDGSSGHMERYAAAGLMHSGISVVSSPLPNGTPLFAAHHGADVGSRRYPPEVHRCSNVECRPAATTSSSLALARARLQSATAGGFAPRMLSVSKPVFAQLPRAQHHQRTSHRWGEPSLDNVSADDALQLQDDDGAIEVILDEEDEDVDDDETF